MNVHGTERMDEADKQAVNTKSIEPYTWTQIAERTVWKVFIPLIIDHVGFVVALVYYSFGLYSVPVKLWTIILGIVVHYGINIGITAGAHRLWTHRTYKANLPLRISLMLLYSGSGMNPLYFWIRDHRLHHKYSDTDADPHNANRGFFFSHYGWIFMKRHPECHRRRKEILMNDIEADPVVMFQRKYAYRLQLLFCYIVPTIIPVTLWNETIMHTIMTQWFIRKVIVYNLTFSVNSIAHLWGSRPYNRFINPVENKLVSMVTLGEGSHNYHHTFPWDYKTSEFPYFNFNITTLFIDAMARLGLAYDLRQPSPELVEKVVRNTGYKSAMNGAR